jgi:predicted nucleotidyltransferase
MTPMEQAKTLLPKGYTLLYLTEFGSHLYGTHSDASDRDYKGIYLPSQASVILGTAQHSIVSSTGTKDARNGNEDVDFSMFSLQHFLRKLTSGEINATDILFSMFSKSAIHTDHKLNLLIKQQYKQFLSKNTKAYTGYCMGQASRYGIKGSRYGDLATTDKFLEKFNTSKRLDQPIAWFINDIPKLKYVQVVEKDSLRYISILGKLHQSTVPLYELQQRIKKELEAYGNRSKASTEGVDWKALSHAYRACMQVLELIGTGFIRFPLTYAEPIKEIKYNKTKEALPVILEAISTCLETIEIDIQKSDLPDEPNKDYADDVILDFYNIKE